MDYAFLQNWCSTTIPVNERHPTILITKESEKEFKNYEKSSLYFYTSYYFRRVTPVFCCKKMTRAIK
jgi:hypothetical protein